MSGPDRRPGADRPGRDGAGRPDRERPESRRGPARAIEGEAPPLPEDVTGTELDKSVRAELSALRPETAAMVGRHLVMTGRLLDEDPETAYRHAAAARDKAARLASVREAVGLAAYASGRYAEALAELRTVRRLTGSNVHLPVMADCERGMGRPERALALAATDEANRLDRDGQVEMLIVAAGARADMGQLDAAVVTLQVPELKSRATGTWLARLRSAYADALAAVGRTDEARTWLDKALEADVDGEAGIADRLAEDEGLLFEDLDELGEDDDGDDESDDDLGDDEDLDGDDDDEGDDEDDDEDLDDEDLDDEDEDLDGDDDELDAAPVAADVAEAPGTPATPAATTALFVEPTDGRTE